MKQPDNATDDPPVPLMAVERDVRKLLSDLEIAEILASHMEGSNEMAKMFRECAFHRRVRETSVHRSRCGRKVLVTSEYDCLFTVVELINEQ